MKCSLYGEKGLPHSYRRGDFKHDVLGALYACADIGGIMVPGHVLCRDLWAEQAARAGLVSADAARGYAAKLTECLSADDLITGICGSILKFESLSLVDRII